MCTGPCSRMSQKVTSDPTRWLTPANSGSFRKEAFKMMSVLDSQECEVAATCDSCTAGRPWITGNTPRHVPRNGSAEKPHSRDHCGSRYREGLGIQVCGPQNPQPTDLSVSWGPQKWWLPVSSCSHALPNSGKASLFWFKLLSAGVSLSLLIFTVTWLHYQWVSVLAFPFRQVAILWLTGGCVTHVCHVSVSSLPTLCSDLDFGWFLRQSEQKMCAIT